MDHFRAVVHIAAADEAAARKIVEAFEKRWASTDPEAPYVTVVSLEPRKGPPGKPAAVAVNVSPAAAACKQCGERGNLRYRWKPDLAPASERLNCFGCGWDTGWIPYGTIRVVAVNEDGGKASG